MRPDRRVIPAITHVDGSAIDYRAADMTNHRGILACNGAAFDAVAPIEHDQDICSHS